MALASCPKSAALLPLSLFLLVIPLVLLLSSSPVLGNEQEDALVGEWIRCVEKQPDPLLGSEYQIPDIYTRKNSSFSDVLNLRALNLRYTGPQTQKPLVIVAPKVENVVPRIIKCTRSHGLKIRIRSGGHDFEGLSYRAPSGEPFILLDMFNLNNVDVEINSESESATAWVQSGATLGQVYYWIAKKTEGKYAFPGGVCPTVGAGGHISGGGYGVLMRMYGLSVDNVDDARIVNAEGEELKKETMGDLFWAIRGGGGSSFGVILAWKINLVQVPPIVTVFDIRKPILGPGVNHILYKWQEVAPGELPKELFVRLKYSIKANPNGTPGEANADFTALFLGNKTCLVEIMRKKFPELGLELKHCKEMSWIDSVLDWARIKGTPESLINYDALRKSQRANYVKIKADFVKEAIPEDDLLDLWTRIQNLGVSRIRMEWTPYGGMMDKIEESALPYSHRKGNLYSVFYVIMWEDDSLTDSYVNKSRELYALMERYVSSSPRESVFNYFDLDLQDFGEIYFGKNFDRLVEVKTRVDPTDFFSHEHSIPTKSKLEISRSSRRGSSKDAFSAAM